MTTVYVLTHTNDGDVDIRGVYATLSAAQAAWHPNPHREWIQYNDEFWIYSTGHDKEYANISAFPLLGEAASARSTPPPTAVVTAPPPRSRGDEVARWMMDV